MKMQGAGLPVAGRYPALWAYSKEGVQVFVGRVPCSVGQAQKTLAQDGYRSAGELGGQARPSRMARP